MPSDKIVFNRKKFSRGCLITGLTLTLAINGLGIYATIQHHRAVDAAYASGYTDGVEFGKSVFADIYYECGYIRGTKDTIESAVLTSVSTQGYDISFNGTSHHYNTTPEAISLSGFELTAYCPCSKCCGSYANGITSTGKTATANHTAAVDPKVIPYGTHFIYNGVEYVAEDCGGAIKGNRIDIYFDSHSEAQDFGRRKNQVISILN